MDTIWDKVGAIGAFSSTTGLLLAVLSLTGFFGTPSDTPTATSIIGNSTVGAVSSKVILTFALGIGLFIAGGYLAYVSDR